jgi:hypothetical protein
MRWLDGDVNWYVASLRRNKIKNLRESSDGKS